MKKRPFYSLFFFSPLFIPAQDSVKTRQKPFIRNALFVEAGGIGGVYSIGWERRSRHCCMMPYYWHFGASVLPFGSRVIVDFPVSINIRYYLVRKWNLIAETGTGQVLILDVGGGKGGTIRGTLNFGLWFEPKKDKCFLKFAYTPFYSYLYNFQYNHWGGIAFGYYLKK